MSRAQIYATNKELPEREDEHGTQQGRQTDSWRLGQMTPIPRQGLSESEGDGDLRDEYRRMKRKQS